MADRHRRGTVHAQVTVQRGPAGIPDAQTHMRHLVSDESAVAHRHAGSYLAVCGARVLAGSLSAPERDRCPV